MRPAHRDVVITGLGAVSAAGADCAALWTSIEEGRSGIAPIRRFSTEVFGVHTGAIVEEWAAPCSADESLAESLCSNFSERAGREAMRHAGLDTATVAPSRIALAFGTGLGDRTKPIHMLAEELARALGITGPCLTVSTACSSSTGAIGLARDLIALDAADVVLAGGADVLTPEVFAGFHALGVLTSGSCAPYSLPFGTTLGEGAGFVVLERAEHARARGANVLASLNGYGLSGDAWHETSPEPKGRGVERAIRAALSDAALSATDIGYVNAHGSGTEANDASEWQGIQRGLGAHACTIPVSSSKGALGHGQGAAGALEVIVTILAMEKGVVPPTLNFAALRPHSPTDPVHQRHPRATTYDRALSVNSAFGGANASIIVSRHSDTSRMQRRGEVRILGIGAAGSGRLGSEFSRWSLRNGNGDSPVDVPSLEDLVPTADPRGLDPTSRALTAATALALADAGICVRGETRDRTGLLVGQVRASPQSTQVFRRSIEERGLKQLSAPAFARIVLNAAAGTCSKLLSLRGPLSAITTGTNSGLVALVFAAELLATRTDVDLVAAASATESSEDGAAAAACMMLGNAGGVGRARAERGVCVSGWALAAPGRVSDAVERATRDADDAPDLVIDVGRDGSGRTTDDPAMVVLAFMSAVRAVINRDAARALVTCNTGDSMSAAILLSQ